MTVNCSSHSSTVSPMIGTPMLVLVLPAVMVAVPVAVSVYEKALPTAPVAVRAEVMTGAPPTDDDYTALEAAGDEAAAALHGEHAAGPGLEFVEPARLSLFGLEIARKARGDHAFVTGLADHQT